MLYKAIESLGKYLLLMRRALTRPQRGRVFAHQLIKEFYQLGYNSLGIILIISLFIGALICIQIKLNIEAAWMPKFTIGYAMREVTLLEFSSSIICIILAGKVGSNIASEIGTMRITQQIDALDVMGVNSANYIILPKITALIISIPLLVTFSIAASFFGAYLICALGHLMPVEDLTLGLQFDFVSWHLWSGYIKAFIYAFLISSVSFYF